ncbi:Mannose-specific lectin [Nymphaea thermarum]|nr:Mannose-specific lectin [Nymphaea thermarum]
MAPNVLLSGQTLNPGEFLENGPYKFIMQLDCNLVLYDGDRPLWASNTRMRGTECRAILQKDANLVIYSENNDTVWASGTARERNNYRLIMQLDGNVVIYDPAGRPLWATNTCK